MSFLFKRTPRTPQELVRNLNDLIEKIDSTNDNNNNKYQDECFKYLKQIKLILHGDDEVDPQPDQISSLAQEIYQTDCLYYLMKYLANLDFDSRKDVSIIFLTLLRRKIGNTSPTVDYLMSKPEIFILLVKGQNVSEIGLICGSILRDCIKFEIINHYILYSSYFWNFFQYVQNDIFEIATDSFITLHDLLTSHKKLVSLFLQNNYEPITKEINKLIQLKNYVTKRQSVRLLNEIVLNKSNQYFLTTYFNDTTNLKLIMILLSDKLKNLQLEGFQIFKYFIAKPKKSKDILSVLIKNKSNFIEFFEKFDTSIANDANLIDEKDYILDQITRLPDIGEVP